MYERVIVQSFVCPLCKKRSNTHVHPEPELQMFSMKCQECGGDIELSVRVRNGKYAEILVEPVVFYQDEDVS